MVLENIENVVLQDDVIEVPADAVREAAKSGEPLRLTIQTVIAHAGPLPPANVLRQYDEAYPGLTKIIVDEFRAESAHRRSLQKFGQRGAILVAMTSIIVGAVLGYLTQSWSAALAITGPVCGTVGTAQLLEFWLKHK